VREKQIKISRVHAPARANILLDMRMFDKSINYKGVITQDGQTYFGQKLTHLYSNEKKIFLSQTHQPMPGIGGLIWQVNFT
jgi:hypothetical protein